MVAAREIRLDLKAHVPDHFDFSISNRAPIHINPLKGISKEYLPCFTLSLSSNKPYPLQIELKNGKEHQKESFELKSVNNNSAPIPYSLICIDTMEIIKPKQTLKLNSTFDKPMHEKNYHFGIILNVVDWKKNASDIYKSFLTIEFKTEG